MKRRDSHRPFKLSYRDKQHQLPLVPHYRTNIVSLVSTRTVFQKNTVVVFPAAVVVGVAVVVGGGMWE